MSEIQQRIAAAIQRQAELNMECDRDMDEDPHDHWLDLAKAVVSELGLTQEQRQMQNSGLMARLGIDRFESRYVTDWMPDA